MGYIGQYQPAADVQEKSFFFVPSDGWASNFVLPKAEKLLDG